MPSKLAATRFSAALAFGFSTVSPLPAVNNQAEDKAHSCGNTYCFPWVVVHIVVCRASGSLSFFNDRGLRVLHHFFGTTQADKRLFAQLNGPLA